MISIEQCRGARGILSWTQQDLADASGLSKTAINNFEKGHSDIKAESLKAIRVAFESADIEFLGQDGMRKRADNIQILRGSSALIDLLHDIAETMKNASAGDVLISYANPHLASQIPTQALFEHIESLKKQNISQRILCAEGARAILSPNDQCRWLPQEMTNANMTTYLYGSKVAFELWDRTMIIVVNSADAHYAERCRFEHLWVSARVPPESSDRQKKTA